MMICSKVDSSTATDGCTTEAVTTGCAIAVVASATTLFSDADALTISRGSASAIVTDSTAAIAGVSRCGSTVPLVIEPASTILHNHAQDVWACDFRPVIDIFFRQHFVFFIVDLASRRVVHFAVTDTLTDHWTAQQLREATPFGQGPKYLVRDNDSKFGTQFSRVAAGAGIQELRTPIRSPNANAVAERFLGSVRRECLDHILVLNLRHLRRVIQDYVQYFD